MPTRLRAKNNRKEARTRRGNELEEGPAIRTTVYTRTPTQLRLASPARTTRTARTKRKRRRNEADLPVTGVGQAGQPPPNLRYQKTKQTNIYIYIHMYSYNI